MESFCDLNIMYPKPGKEQLHYEICAQLGYRTIAFNHVVDMSKGRLLYFHAPMMTLAPLSFRSPCFCCAIPGVIIGIILQHLLRISYD